MLPSARAAVPWMTRRARLAMVSSWASAGPRIAYVMQGDAVFRRVTGREPLRCDELAKAPPPGLVGQVVVDAVAERQETQTVIDRIELVAEGVGHPTDMPADAARALSGQYDARLPALPQDGIQPVRPPRRAFVGERCARALHALNRADHRR